MRIVVTGSLGNISKPLTQRLCQNGHSVTVISRTAARQEQIEALGATAANGTLEDIEFLTAAFAGADAVYCMLPPPNFWVPNFNLDRAVETIARNYTQAIEKSEVKRVVQLSSVGAHTDAGNGLIAIHHTVEKILNELPSDVAITRMRPVGFFQNLLGFQGAIKTQGVMASNYGATDRIPWVSTTDIAAAVADELEVPSGGRTVRYVASDELTCQEVATILGNAIGLPDLQWIFVEDEVVHGFLAGAGMPPQIASGLVEMHAAMHTGRLFEDYYRNKPTLSQIKTIDFAKEFAAAYSK